MALDQATALGGTAADELALARAMDLRSLQLADLQPLRGCAELRCCVASGNAISSLDPLLLCGRCSACMLCKRASHAFGVDQGVLDCPRFGR